MAFKRSTPRQSPVLQPTAAAASETDAVEVSLRPKMLSDYVGQTKIKEHLLVHIEAARKRNEPLGHTLLHGPPGLGKTTLAHIIAQEMSSQLKITSGPAIEKPGDLASLLTNLAEGDVLFIDEIHRLRPAIEEVLYGAMEDYVLDIMIGKGPTARSVRLNLKPFTLVGATTKAGAVSAPLRDRFMQQFKLAFYDQSEMQQIVERSAGILNVSMEPLASSRIASASRATPRIGNRLVRAVRDFAQVRDEDVVSLASVEKTLGSLDIDAEGLDATDRLLLQTIVDTFAGGPVGLSTLAAILAEEGETIEDVYEPYLMQQGFLQRTPKGRMVTRKAYEKLGRDMPEGAQGSLF
ncbi:MAG TPA: Holliday junction branch migration DNA helicase RuvB [Candidatus Peribacteraceae bacterium]|nr:Holliday junction branch migration DNA helicase RuvB [Candidatus Peribacteraceae bacterium]